MSRQYICPGCQMPQTVHPCPACNPNYGFKRMDPGHVRRAQGLTELTPERLREWAERAGQWASIHLLAAQVAEIADAWDRDRREIERLRTERDRLWEALVNVRMHTGHKRLNPDQLHMDLLKSIARIADEALAATEKRDD